jgi:hypothetical protein
VNDAQAPVTARVGDRLVGGDRRRIGRVDAVFADYLLIRTNGLLPVDLFVPLAAVSRSSSGVLATEENRASAYQAWHRPLKRAPHS